MTVENAAAENVTAAADGLTAKAVLDDLRDQLKEPADDDMALLLKISGEIGELDGRHWSSSDAAAWKARGETSRERIRAMHGRQSGFKAGLIVGFLAGFVLAGLFGAMLALHWMVAQQ
ncbi:MAG: hypothetical protein EWM45_14240 [Rhodopseudomonas palustris]|nr:MAG: hypothetical protein EWM45_14240 [Rhodopseudomonas palustris]